MNRVLQFSLLIASTAVCLLGTHSNAAEISVQPVVTAFYDPISFAQLPVVPPGVNPGAPVVVQVDVMMEVLSLAPGEDSFGLAAFSFDLSGNDPGELIPDPEAGGWMPNFLTYFEPPPFPGTPVAFALNADVGIDGLDLQGILVQMATGAFSRSTDPRRNIGEPGSLWGAAVLLGSAFLEWDGMGEVSFNLNPLEVAAKLTNGQFVMGTAVPSATIVLGTDVPEPSSLALLGICVAGIVFKR